VAAHMTAHATTNVTESVTAYTESVLNAVACFCWLVCAARTGRDLSCACAAPACVVLLVGCVQRRSSKPWRQEWTSLTLCKLTARTGSHSLKHARFSVAEWFAPRPSASRLRPPLLIQPVLMVQQELVSLVLLFSVVRCTVCVFPVLWVCRYPDELALEGSAMVFPPSPDAAPAEGGALKLNLRDLSHRCATGTLRASEAESVPSCAELCPILCALYFVPYCMPCCVLYILCAVLLHTFMCVFHALCCVVLCAVTWQEVLEAAAGRVRLPQLPAAHPRLCPPLAGHA